MIPNETMVNRYADVDWDRKHAIKHGKHRYRGKVCEKHPHIGGLRLTVNRNCPICLSSATNKKRHKNYVGVNFSAYDRKREDAELHDLVKEVWED